MTAAEFRKLALAMPEASEASHMDHPDFRVGGKIFATLGPKEAWGMVKLPPKLQAQLVKDDPEAFERGSGAWGRWGCTMVRLKKADKQIVKGAMIAAWRNSAPKRLLKEYDEQ